jgi:hypothetical protein
LLFAAVVLAKELKDEKVKLVSAETSTVLIDPAWVADDAFHWNGIEWTNVYGGCARNCAVSAVVAKTDACWRMATEDGSLYIGQRLGNVNPNIVGFKGDYRGRVVATATSVDAPLVAWKVLPGAWNNGAFVDTAGRRWRLYFQGTAENLVTQQPFLQVVEAQTGNGLRLITKGGSFLLGPVVPPEQKGGSGVGTESPKPQPMDNLPPPPPTGGKSGQV